MRDKEDILREARINMENHPTTTMAVFLLPSLLEVLIDIRDKLDHMYEYGIGLRSRD